MDVQTLLCTFYLLDQRRTSRRILPTVIPQLGTLLTTPPSLNLYICLVFVFDTYDARASSVNI